MEVNFREIIDSLETREAGSDISTLYYDAMRYLESSLSRLDDRIVIFVDDLDRCSPEKGLEVLESIKNLFDIKGLVFVIGMNSNTINTLVQRKFTDNPNASGFDYVRKIVQLPFHIPDWVEKDIDSYIDSVISNELAGSAFKEEFLSSDDGQANKNKELLIKAVESNPREIKRFINHIILAKAVFDKPVRNLIVVQALKFRHDWNKFLEFITQLEDRKDFLTQCKKLANDNSALDKYRKLLDNTYPAFYSNDDPLRKFIDAGAGDVLLSIDDMEEYRRSLQAVSLDRGYIKGSGVGITPANTLILTVHESYRNDVGKGIARIDYVSMDALGVSAGEVVELHGDKVTVGRRRRISAVTTSRSPDGCSRRRCRSSDTRHSDRHHQTSKTEVR